MNLTFAAIKTFGPDYIAEILGQFEEENPGFKVEYIELPTPPTTARKCTPTW